MSTYPQLTLGWRLRMALEHAGVTVNEMADVLGIKSRDTMAAWLHDRRTPRAAYVRQWAVKTGVPYNWLVGADPGLDPVSDVPVRGSGWILRRAIVPAPIIPLRRGADRAA